MKVDQLKNTTLDDSASIYQARQEQTEKQKFSEMTFKEKVGYFNDYYRLKTIVFVAITIGIIYLAYTILNPGPKTVLHITSLNNSIDTETAETLENNLSDYLNLDKDKENVFIDTALYLSDETAMSEMTMASEQKLMALFFNGEIDVFIAPEAEFTHYAESGFFSKLSEQLTTEMCSYFGDSFYYTQTEEDPAKSAYGIYLKDSILYDKTGQPMESPVLGIAVNSKHAENAVEFIRYLFELEK
jgi:hypothetical protein